MVFDSYRLEISQYYFCIRTFLRPETCVQAKSCVLFRTPKMTNRLSKILSTPVFAVFLIIQNTTS